MARPQRLGLLPTWWFWNDWERQRLLLPLIMVTAAPLGVLLFLAAAKLQWSIWMIEGFLLFDSTLLLGLVERHIRRKVATRTASQVIARVDEQDDQPSAISGPDHSGVSSASRVGGE